MDKQTAVDLLDNLLGMVEDNHDSDYDTAIKMGIDALQSNAPNALSALDCVGRQAALEAMDTWDKYGCDPDGKLVRYDDDTHYIPYVQYEDMVNAVKNLPSQPEHTETHSCDCERTETHGWIPVTERLPDDGVEVWVTIKGHDVIRCEEGETLEQAIDRINKIRWVTRGYWSDEEHAWNDPSFGCPLMVQPIAWMPMEVPEPWRGEEDDA